VFDRSQVPSNPDASMETRLVLAAFAAQGYIVNGADYFGRGQSDLPDSYLVRQSTQQANLDMLLAARDFLAARCTLHAARCTLHAASAPRACFSAGGRRAAGSPCSTCAG
jgi:hypothetical protein